MEKEKKTSQRTNVNFPKEKQTLTVKEEAAYFLKTHPTITLETNRIYTPQLT